ncbi:MAG: hypothetical protein AB2653_17510 [Candidatus Thiodiazotropha endolucinida]
MPKLRAKDRPKRPDSAELAKPKKVHVIHGGKASSLLTADLDGRTRLAKQYKEQVEALERHLGNDLTPPQARLVDQAARLALLGGIAWQEIITKQPFSKGGVSPAIETFIKATQQERQVLIALGIERRTKDIPDLSNYLEKKYGDTNNN